MAPIRARILFSPAGVVAPKRAISPAVGLVWAVTIRMMVVLPAPFRPTRP